jgi:hypothetical protein
MLFIFKGLEITYKNSPLLFNKHVINNLYANISNFNFTAKYFKKHTYQM